MHVLLFSKLGPTSLIIIILLNRSGLRLFLSLVVIAFCTGNPLSQGVLDTRITRLTKASCTKIRVDIFILLNETASKLFKVHNSVTAH